MIFFRGPSLIDVTGLEQEQHTGWARSTFNLRFKFEALGIYHELRLIRRYWGQCGESPSHTGSGGLGFFF